MKKILVVSDYWIGDTIKTQTACKRLKEENQADYIDFLIKWPQLEILCRNNPYIDNVIVSFDIDNTINRIKDNYSEIRRNSGPEWNVKSTPGFLYQKHCGVLQPENDFDVYTDKETDDLVKSQVTSIKIQHSNKLLIGVDLSWRGKSNELGYITHLPIMELLEPLNKDYVLIPVGLPHDKGRPVQTYSAQSDPQRAKTEFTTTASIIKYLDILLTSESGISNLAIGIKTTPIIYSKDFLYHLAGPNGIFGSSDTPEKFMGPEAYGKLEYVDSIHQDYGDTDYAYQFKRKIEQYEHYRTRI